MLDGSATESMTAPVSFRPNSNGVAFEQTSPGGAFKEQEGETFFEKQSHQPPKKSEVDSNFSSLPPNLLEERNKFVPNKLPGEDEMKAYAQHLIEEAGKKNPSTTSAPAMIHEQIDQTPMPKFSSPDETFIGPTTNSEATTSSAKTTSNIQEKIKAVWEKVKTVVKKIWYLGSGSFIWDKGSKPT